VNWEQEVETATARRAFWRAFRTGLWAAGAAVTIVAVVVVALGA